MKESVYQRRDTPSCGATETSQQKTTRALQDNRESSMQLQQQRTVQRNNTGLPDNLKAGIENLSGYSMDDVRVHYNSPKPAQLQAHAYAQGTNIHLAPGQEKHLPHEAWHVVQQAQGRVRPTVQMKGAVDVNDDVGLEREADLMGGQASTLGQASLAQPTSDSDIEMQSGSTTPSGGGYGAEVERSARQQAPSRLIQGLFSTSRGSKTQVAQGRFMAGYTVLNRNMLDPVWQELTTAVRALAAATPSFEELAESQRDEGTFYRWVREQVQAIDAAQQVELNQEEHGHAQAMAEDSNWERAKTILARHGIADGALRAALRAMGPVNVGNLNLEQVKTNELDSEEYWQDAPPSPRHESRLLQIPRLVERLDRAFRSQPLLSFFYYILGGGAAMAIKRPMLGRLGRASTNMRDIDMDFQVAPERIGELRDYLRSKGIDSLDALMARVLTEMRIAIDTIDEPELADALRTDDVKISGRNTVMFNKDDLEYSFHFVNDEPLLGFNNMPIDNEHSIKVIDDDSHWALTKSALRARLKRPDKIQKTLIDALVQIGPPNGPHHNKRLTETAAIVFGGARNIGTARNTLRRLAGPAGPLDDNQQPQWPRQPIAGLPNATEWQSFLDSRTLSHYDRERNPKLTRKQIRGVREDYRKLFNQILNSIIVAGNERQDIVDNAKKLRREIAARFIQVPRWVYGSPKLSTRRLFPGDAPTLRRPEPEQREHTLFAANEQDLRG